MSRFFSLLLPCRDADTDDIDVPDCLLRGASPQYEASLPWSAKSAMSMDTTIASRSSDLASPANSLEASGARLLVLDEVLDALAMGLVDAAAVTRVLKRGTGELEVVLTGRNPSEDIASHADYLTEMVCKKHPFERGVPSREGVEY